ncbi:5-methyltetrahydropteroyltriglutamate--homocysteine methyltransferase [Streptococcus mitis]|uniref:5-methyltetrahydropteroyltriglutamate--homocysteine methyltransferase n=1 Tax=Streptococcus mitis TaxID=28037 RepID=A0A1X1KG63_STRMT|nr:5-methyltetrahydropteroyltriglutamate--homocysteine methyltransferase [Streptococcus mitis]
MKLYALPTKIKIPSRQATQRKIGNLTTERLLLGRFIFFHRVVGVFNYSRYKSLERFDAKASNPFTLIAIRRLAKCFTNSLVK